MLRFTENLTAEKFLPHCVNKVLLRQITENIVNANKNLLSNIFFVISQKYLPTEDMESGAE